MSRGLGILEGSLLSTLEYQSFAILLHLWHPASPEIGAGPFIRSRCPNDNDRLVQFLPRRPAGGIGLKKSHEASQGIILFFNLCQPQPQHHRQLLSSSDIRNILPTELSPPNNIYKRAY